MEVFAYLDDVSCGHMRVTANTVRAFAFLRGELEDIGIVANTANTVAPPPKGHAATAEEISLLESVDVRIVGEGEMTVVGVPIGTDEYVLERTLEVVRDGGADRYGRCLAFMPDTQAAVLIAIESLGQRTSYLERALDTGLSLEACRRADNGVHWAYGRILERPGATVAQPFFQEGFPGNQLTSTPHQQAQARLSTGAGGLGLPSTEARRMSASIGNRVGTLPEVTADLTGRLRDQVRRGLPESNIITQLGGSLREVEDTWRVTKEAIAGIVPEYWLGLGAEGDLVLTPPEADMLAAYDAVTTNSSKTQQKLGMLDNQGRHAARTASLEQLLEKERPPGPGDPLGGSETKAFATACYRSLQGAGATACPRARPTDLLHAIPTTDLLGMGRRFTGIEEHVAMRCPYCDAVDVDTRHARICPRAWAQMN